MAKDTPISLGRLTITDKSAWRSKSRRWRAVLIDEDGVDQAEGFGSTAAKAKDAMARTVLKTLRVAGVEPLLINVGHGLGALIFAGDGEFGYRILRNGTMSRCTLLCGDSRREAEIRVRRHLAQYVYDCDPDEGGMAALHPDDTEGRLEHARWLTWQRAYAKAKARGLGDIECRLEADKETI